MTGDSAPTRAERKAERALQQADVAAARGHVDEALELYRAAAEGLPGDPRVLAGLVRVSIARGDFEDAVAFDDRVRASAGGPPRALAPRERCDLWLAAARERAESLHPDPFELTDRIAADEACADTEAGPIRAAAWALESERAGQVGDDEARIAALRAAVAADPGREDLDERLARALLAAGQRQEAVRALSDALRRHPEVAELQTLMLVALGLPEAAPGVADAPAPEQP